MFKKIFHSIALMSSLIAGATIQSQALSIDPLPIEGLWLTGSGESRVQIQNCGAQLCGVITWLREDAAKGKVTKDKKNKDRSLRKRPMVGVKALTSLTPKEASVWKGRAYNPGDGNTYSAKLKFINSNALEVSGCILGGLVCKKQIWYRLNPAKGSITGDWYVANGKSKINAYSCDNKLCAKVTWIEPGQPASIKGKELLFDVKQKGNSWSGKALNPYDNKKYSATMTQISDNMIELKACVAKVACQKLFWHRGL